MHTGIISFCDRVAYNIKNNEIKQSILDEIDSRYNVKIIQKHFHKMTTDSIRHITATPHYITIKTNGNPYFLYFTHYDNVEIAYFIDKKIQQTYKVPRIIINRGQFHKDLFTGTLIDGEMARCNDKSWTFVMNDIIAYKGKHLINASFEQRMKHLYTILDSEHVKDDPMDMCTYKIKPYYNLSTNTIDQISKMEYPMTIRGIYFWATSLKYKPKLYNYNDNLIQSVNIPIKDKPEFILKEPPYVDKTLCSTDSPDVYKIVDDNTFASVQTIEQSHMLREAFKNQQPNAQIKFKCSYNTKWNKWSPKEICSH